MYRKIFNAVDGKKTFIVAVVTALLNLAVAFNWTSPAHLMQINTVLAALGLAALRDGIKKVE